MATFGNLANGYKRRSETNGRHQFYGASQTNMKTAIALLCLAAVSLGAPEGPAPYHPAPAPYHPAPAPYHPAPAPAPYHPAPAPAPYHPAPAYKEEPAVYQYAYAVQDDYAYLNFGHNEARDGYATNGEYHVQLPDGRLQTVKYHVADDYSGYVADVSYSGEAKYDAYKPAAPYHPAPAPYHPAPAPYAPAHGHL